MNINTLTVDDKPVLIIDDFFNKEICVNWLRYYMNCTFSLHATEDTSDALGQNSVKFVHGMKKIDLENVFEMSTTILPYVNNWNEKNNTDFKYTDCVRSHVNLVQECDEFHGHVDVIDRDTLIFLWFGNPYFKDIGGGFYLGEGRETLIEHKFNRCIIFPGNLFHQVQSVVDKDEVRLTVYIGFHKQDSKEKELYFEQSSMLNAFNKDNFEIQQLSKSLHKDFGIGN